MASTDARPPGGAAAAAARGVLLAAWGGATPAPSPPADIGAPASVDATDAVPGVPGPMVLTSTDLVDGGPIADPQVCTALGGGNQPPALTWTGVPEAATSLALVVSDPDAPVEGGFVHWVVVDLDPATGGLAPGLASGRAGRNSAGEDGYLGPCPPAGTPHHYVFTLYAFAAPPTWAEHPTGADVVDAAPAAIAVATLTGIYGRPEAG